MTMKAFFALCLLSTLSLFAVDTPAPHEQLDLRIPVVDMRDFYDTEKKEQFLDTLYYAMTKIGFFAVRHTGVDTRIMKEGYAAAEKFFKQDLEYKKASFIPALGGQRGFVPGERAKGNTAKDCKEFYHMGRELPQEELQRLSLAKNIWPDQEGFKKSMLALYNELDRYVVPLQEAIVAVINKGSNHPIPSSFLNEKTKNGDVLLRALYYPALNEEQLANREGPLFWAAEHTDIDLLAILPYATEKGS